MSQRFFPRYEYYGRAIRAGRGFGALGDVAYTIIRYEGHEYIKNSKQNSWRWENESTIHLSDGRAFESFDAAVGANGPQYVEVRRPVVATDPRPEAQARVRQMYVQYLNRDPLVSNQRNGSSGIDQGGLDFWTNVYLTTGEQAVVNGFLASGEYLALHTTITPPATTTTTPPVTTTPPATTPPASGEGFLDSITGFISENKLLAAGIAVGLFVVFGGALDTGNKRR